jgi:hypothetical protein
VALCLGGVLCTHQCVSGTHHMEGGGGGGGEEGGVGPERKGDRECVECR